MICPRCGSNNISTQIVTETTTDTKSKGFGCVKAFCGYILFNVPGILCGLCGMGKEKRTVRNRSRKVSVCQNCGHQF